MFFFVKVVSTFKGVKLEQGSFGKIILELSHQFGKMAENLVKSGRSTIYHITMENIYNPSILFSSRYYANMTFGTTFGTEWVKSNLLTHSV